MDSRRRTILAAGLGFYASGIFPQEKVKLPRIGLGTWQTFDTAARSFQVLLLPPDRQREVDLLAGMGALGGLPNAFGPPGSPLPGGFGNFGAFPGGPVGNPQQQAMQKMESVKHLIELIQTSTEPSSEELASSPPSGLKARDRMLLECPVRVAAAWPSADQSRTSPEA